MIWCRNIRYVIIGIVVVDAGIRTVIYIHAIYICWWEIIEKYLSRGSFWLSWMNTFKIVIFYELCIILLNIFVWFISDSWSIFAWVLLIKTELSYKSIVNAIIIVIATWIWASMWFIGIYRCDYILFSYISSTFRLNV